MTNNEAYNFIVELAMKAVPTEVVNFYDLNEACIILDKLTKEADKNEET